MLRYVAWWCYGVWRGGVTVCGVVAMVMLRCVAWWCYGVWCGGVKVCGVVVLRCVAW